MRGDHFIVLTFLFFIGLLMIIIATVSYFNINSNQNQNTTKQIHLNDSFFLKPFIDSLDYESMYNCLTDDGHDFNKPYKDIEYQNQSKLKNLKYKSVLDSANTEVEYKIVLSNDDTISKKQKYNLNRYEFNEKLRKIMQTCKNGSKLNNNESLKENLIYYIPIGQFSEVGQIANTVLCLLNYISNELRLEIDIKGDARYFFEFKLLEFLQNYNEISNKVNLNNDNKKTIELHHNYDEIRDCLLKLFRQQYYFTNMPNIVVSSSFFYDFYDIDFNENIKYLKIKNVKKHQKEDIDDTNVTSSFTKYYFRKFDEKNTNFFDFSYEHLFERDIFQNLNANNPTRFKKRFLLIKSHIIKKIKNEISNIIDSNEFNRYKKIVILLPSKREFLKLACLDNYNNKFNSVDGAYFYKYSGVSDNYDRNYNSKMHITDIGHRIVPPFIITNTEKFILYKSFLEFYEDFIKTLLKDIKNMEMYNIDESITRNE